MYRYNYILRVYRIPCNARLKRIKKTLETEISHFECGSQITIVADHTKYLTNRNAIFFSTYAVYIYIYYIVYHRVCHVVRVGTSTFSNALGSPTVILR